jgi:hypothetical protein
MTTPKAKAPAKAAPAAEVNDELAAGEEPSKDAAYYCPGCGKRSDLEGECAGTPAAPHQPIAYVSTKELAGDESKHTAAPASE